MWTKPKSLICSFCSWLLIYCCTGIYQHLEVNFQPSSVHMEGNTYIWTSSYILQSSAGCLHWAMAASICCWFVCFFVCFYSVPVSSGLTWLWSFYITLIREWDSYLTWKLWTFYGSITWNMSFLLLTIHLLCNFKIIASIYLSKFLVAFVRHANSQAIF